MTGKVRSAKGQMVDFDLLKIKQQLESEPAPIDVQARQTLIDTRLRRRMRTVKKPSTPPSQSITVAPSLPAAEQPQQPEVMIDVVKEQPVTTKQKARSKKK